MPTSGFSSKVARLRQWATMRRMPAPMSNPLLQSRVESKMMFYWASMQSAVMMLGVEKTTSM